MDATPAREPGPPGARPTGKLTLAEGRRYLLELVNRDRRAQGLPPVELDVGPAQASGQRHAEDMARHGFLGHWGTDGSSPEQRHTEAGGADMVLENASCLQDLKPRPLDPDPRIDASALEHAEHLFFDEVPPNDGHRKNILRPHHTRVGIGIALSRELPVPCVTQEFVDGYGTYAELPRRVKIGARIHVEGQLRAPAIMGGVGVARVDAPGPLPPAEANRRRNYPVPVPFQIYWPKGFVTPLPVLVEGNHFRVDVLLSEGGKPGLYEVSVFAKLPGNPTHAMVSLRTIEVVP